MQCGTAAAPIPLSQCTPFDPFNLFNSNTAGGLQAAAAPCADQYLQHRNASFTPTSAAALFDLPAGTVQLAAGAVYRKEYTTYTSSVPTCYLNPAKGTCTLGSACSAQLQGGYSVKEAYAEAFIPVLKDLPFFRALNVTLGDRYSKYSTFGSTNNWKVAVEWKPIDDLLLRGTVASRCFALRPSRDVFGAPVSSAPLLSADPCDHITGGQPGLPERAAGWQFRGSVGGCRPAVRRP